MTLSVRSESDDSGAAGVDIIVLRAPPSRRVGLAGGTFTMGSDLADVTRAVNQCRAEPGGRICDPLFEEFCRCRAETFADEAPPHRVTLGPFAIDRFEVTVAAYERCVDRGICSTLPTSGGGARFSVPELPVTLVTWSEAVTYCRSVGGDLPTEAQWERAARGLVPRAYPWGQVFNPFLVNGGRFGIDPFEDKDGFLELAPGGRFPQGRSVDGIYDLAGNVEEWVADWYGEYSEEDQFGPVGPTSGDERVIRGGSYLHGAAWLRASSRGHDSPSARRTFRGFRCAYAD